MAWVALAWGVLGAIVTRSPIDFITNAAIALVVLWGGALLLQLATGKRHA
jgi:hypothetical protein